MRRQTLATRVWLAWCLALLLGVTLSSVMGAPARVRAQVVTPTPTTPPLPEPPGLPASPPTAPAPTATPTAADTRDVDADTATPTRTPAADERPDPCEPNNERASACRLLLDRVNGPYTFLPAGDIDFYSVLLDPAETRVITATLRASDGLDLVVTVLNPANGATLRQESSTNGQVQVVFPPTERGWMVLRVENRAPGSGVRQSYTIDLRPGLAPPPTPEETVTTQPTPRADGLPAPDTLENNWSPQYAPQIAVGVPYVLNFTCPDATVGCVDGDHDYLAVQVKAGEPYIVATYDLGPGTDTVLELFVVGGTQPFLVNDDLHPGRAFLSKVEWIPLYSGTVIVRVGPAHHAGSPVAAGAEQVGAYTLMIAPLLSPQGQQLAEIVQAQSLLPTPAPTVAATAVASTAVPAVPQAPPAPAAPPPPPVVSEEAAPEGRALLVEATTLRVGPSAASAAILELPPEAYVQLQGRTSNGWVLVVPEGRVVPGWLPGAALVAAPATPSAEATPMPDAVGMPVPTIPDQLVPTNRPSSDRVLPQVLAPQALRPISATLTGDQDVRPETVVQDVQVCRSDRDAEVTGTSACAPLRGVTAYLVDGLTGAVLAYQDTNEQGQAQLVGVVRPRTALRVLIPAIGVHQVVLPAQRGAVMVVQVRAVQALEVLP